MCSGALGNRSKWRRKAEAFSARSIDRNPRRDAAEGPHRLAPGVKQARWLHRAAAHLGSDGAHTPRPDQASFYPVYLSVSLQFLFLSHFGPLWVLPEAQTDRGLNDLRIKMSDSGQCRHTSPLSEVHPFATEPGPSSPACPPPRCIHSLRWHFKGEGRRRWRNSDCPALEFRKMDSKYTISFGKGGEGSKWLQPRPFGRFQRRAPAGQFLLTGQGAARTNSRGFEKHRSRASSPRSL